MEGRERVMREKRLYKASLKGDVQSLMELMQEDELTLDHRVPITCFNESSLHVAAMKGHVDFAKALLQHKPDMVTELDSQGRSPLHLAAVNGHAEVVKLLLAVGPSVCLFKDEDGWAPLHLAALKDHVEIVKETVRARPEVMMYPLNRAKAISILHSYVMCNGLDALMPVIEADHSVLNSQDGDGNTILHKATALKQVEVNLQTLMFRLIATWKMVLEYVVSTSTELKVNRVNKKGFTALDVIEQMPKDLKTRQVHELLVEAGAKRGRELSATGQDTNQLRPIEVDEISTPVSTVPTRPPSLSHPKSQEKIKKVKKLLKKKQDGLLLAATVIATMAYQAGLNPPGGVWDGEKVILNSDGYNVTFQAGTSVLATDEPNYYTFFWIFNTVSFMTSLCIILLLMSGIPLLKNRAFMELLTVAVWVTTMSMAATYLAAQLAITPWDTNFREPWNLMGYIESRSTWVLLGVSVLIFLVHTYCFITWIKKLWKDRKDKGISRDGDEGEGRV